MRIKDFAMQCVLATTLLAGCGIQPEDGLTDNGTDPALAKPLDARAAAALEAQAHGLVFQPQLMSSWFSGSIAPGATQHWTWNNASLTAAYVVGLSPIGASTSSACHIKVVRSWDVQHATGEREFHFDIKNVGSIACGTNILLGSKTRVATWGTGGINAGASRNFVWNNANPLSATYFVGVSPSGATSTEDCTLEVTGSWYTQRPSGEREFAFTIKNIGAIACQGDIQLAQTTANNASWATGALAPGASTSRVWNNANPLDRVFVPGLSPAGASGLAPCVLAVTENSYRQVINATGTTEREFLLTVKNVGALACTGTVLLNYLD